MADFAEDKAAQFGAGLAVVGACGKAAMLTNAVGAVAAGKLGVVAGTFLCPPLAIGIGVVCIGAGLINHFGKRNWW